MGIDGARRRSLLIPCPSWIGLIASCGTILLWCGQAKSDPNVLTADQRAIIEKIGKPGRAGDVTFAGAPTDPVGSEVRLPFRDGQTITLARKSSSLQSDGSISWVGEVRET